MQGLKQMSGARSIIGVKRMGELDQKAFHNACKQKVPKDDLKGKLALLNSKWEHEIRKPEWHPFKIIDADRQTKVNILLLILLDIRVPNPGGYRPSTANYGNFQRALGKKPLSGLILYLEFELYVKIY